MREKVQNYVISNIGHIKSIIIRFEDEKVIGTFQNLADAITYASDDELENFIKTDSIPFEDGILTIKF